MTAAAVEPGSLLANRFRVTAERATECARVIDARDELSAATRRVRLLLLRASLSGVVVEAALRKVLRYAVGVSGHAELVSVFNLDPETVALAYSVPEGHALDELESWDAESTASAVRRALEPLHQQGMAHGFLCREVVCRGRDGTISVLGFGIAQALRTLGLHDDAVLLPGSRAATPASDVAAVLRLGAPLEVAAEGASEPEPELAPPPLHEPLPPARPERVAAPVERSQPPPRSAPPPPLAPLSTLPPSRVRGWLGPLALALGAVAMLTGVTTAFVLARRAGPAPTASVAAPPPPLTATVAPPTPPTPPPSGSASQGKRPEGEAELAPLSPPVRTPTPAAHIDAPLPVDIQPTWGPTDAPVTLTLFADLDCPHTRALLPELLRIKTTLGNDLRWVYRHRPLSQHTDARAAARLLAGVGVRLGPGVFWKLVSELAREPDGEPRELLEQWLDQSGLDAAERAELEALPQAASAVDADVELATRLFVRATPTLFINGVRLEGYQPESELLAAVERERRAGLFALLTGLPAESVYVQRTVRNLINIGDDPPERACMTDGGAPVRGSAAAPVTLVHFCAYESVYCQKAELALAALVARRSSDVRIIWRVFPVVPEGDGRTAANFALAARNSGGDKAFWAVHRALLEARAAVDAPALTRVVRGLGLDGESLVGAARARTHDASVKADIELGRKLAVTGVPTQFINGRRKDGQLTLPELEKLLDEELALARRVKEAGRGRVSDLVCSAKRVAR